MATGAFPCPVVCITQTDLQVRCLPFANDAGALSVYPRPVSKTRPKRFTNWFLRDWMATLEVSQTDLVRETDMNKTAVSLLYNDQQDYSPTIIRDIARALNIQPYELLMHPEDAMTLRRLIVEGERVSDLGKRLQLVADRTGTDG